MGMNVASAETKHNHIQRKQHFVVTVVFVTKVCSKEQKED